MSKLRSRNVNELVLGHTATEDMNPSSVIPEHEHPTSVLKPVPHLIIVTQDAPCHICL